MFSLAVIGTAGPVGGCGDRGQTRGGDLHLQRAVARDGHALREAHGQVPALPIPASAPGGKPSASHLLQSPAADIATWVCWQLVYMRPKHALVPDIIMGTAACCMC